MTPAPAGIELAVEGGVGVRCHVLHLRDAIGDHITNAMWWSAHATKRP